MQSITLNDQQRSVLVNTSARLAKAKERARELAAVHAAVQREVIALEKALKDIVSVLTGTYDPHAKFSINFDTGVISVGEGTGDANV